MEKQRVSNNSETDLERVIRESGGKLRLSPKGNTYNRFMKAPRDYAEAALAELESQLLTARAARKIAKLKAGIERWTAVIQKIDAETANQVAA